MYPSILALQNRIQRVKVGNRDGPIATELAMTTLSRLSLLVLVLGMVLGDIIVASVGLVGLCGAAVYFTLKQDAQDPPTSPGFLA
ncbi:hypothetical protein C4Q28_13990 [Pseudomonas sp. SWI6]|nr:hypothetical protein PVLB_12765 [Pseudomonas sp. VLB120]AVD83196.1 hypothetical protein C4Q28_13990 [Pseudomonas sp. SWI6]AVD90355.1 hypothetical protein C4Q26_25820 [Pseudomonas sp. SWI44]